MILDLLLLFFPLNTFNGRLKSIQAVLLVTIQSYGVGCGRSRGLLSLNANQEYIPLFIISLTYSKTHRQA